MTSFPSFPGIIIFGRNGMGGILPHGGWSQAISA